MKNVTRRCLAMMMALVMCASVVFGMDWSVQAATVDYVYSSPDNYILNWGVRGTNATFLSQNAEKFYGDNNTSYLELASLSGSNTVSSVPSSELYKELQDLMEDNHTKITSYNDTRPLYQYTDCQNSGKISNKISSFYSGAEIGPAWDSGDTWNREHTWPDSKGNEGSEEDDIMMLRPTKVNENTSRGNKAYGESGDYYDPNKVSNGTYNLRGDVARIMLYQYVRWGLTNKMWGTSGVMESKDVLLDWMEEDPVDTWELGRNDSVESITGTRNVFVDYPELAFVLFGENIPANYTTPSGNASESAYSISASSNNTSWGTVSVSGNVINAFPATGYEATGYTITNGNATVVKSGNVFTVSATSNVTIKINFAARSQKTIRFEELGNTANTQTAYAGDVIQLPAHTGSVQEGYTFLGWSATSIQVETATTPEFYAVGSNYTVTDNVSLYALYSRIDQSGSSNSDVFEPYSGELTEGDYLIVSQSGAMTAEVKSSRLAITGIELTGNNIITSNGAIIWQLAKDGDYWTLYNASTNKYAAGTGAKSKATLSASVNDSARWTASGTRTYEFLNKGNDAKGVNALLRRNGDYGFACYTNKGTTGQPLQLYKRSMGTTYFFTAVDTSSAGGNEGGGNEGGGSGNTGSTATKNYVKVTEAPADWSGDYLIVYEDGSKAFNGSLTKLDAVNDYIEVTITDGKIEATDEVQASQFTIEKSGDNYIIKSASGYYIGQTSNANGLKSSTSTKYNNTISMNSDSTVNVVGGGAYLRFNNANDQLRFRYYKSSTYTAQKAITLYKYVEEAGMTDQAAPTSIGVVNETIYNKKDGKITGVNAAMEYRKSDEVAYTAITSDTITNLPVGTYYVRYKGDSSHNPSPETMVTISEGRKLKVILPSTQVGYTITASPMEYGWYDTVTVTLTVDEGYTVTDNFKVLYDGLDRGWGKEQRSDVVTFVADDLNIAVEGIAGSTATKNYVKVTEAPADWSGDYLIVYEGGSKAFNGSLTKLDAVNDYITVTINDNKIEATDEIIAAQFTITKSGSNYIIKSASGYYIGQTSNKNGLASSTSTKYNNTISMNSDSTVNVVSGGAYLRFNHANDQLRFRYYKSSSYTGQKAITLYKYVEEAGMTDQAAPTSIGVVNETIYNKKDGKITGVNAAMEYRKSNEVAYTAITSDTITNLPVGTYYVRYKGDSSHNPSPETMVTISEGRKLKVILPSNPVGYTITASPMEYGWYDTVTVTLTVDEGYTVTDNFKVLYDGLDRGWSKEQRSDVVTFVADDLNIAVEGIAVVTKPTAEINVNGNKWTAFWNNLTFGLFFKETQNVTITANDVGSGIKSIEYYLASGELTENEVKEITNWESYNGTFKIDPNNSYVVYAKVTNNAGITTYVNSDGIILDNVAPTLEGIENGKTYYGELTVIKSNEQFYDIKSVTLDGQSMGFLEGTYGFIPADNAEHTVVVEDHAGNKTTYTVTVMKNYTVTYKADGVTVSTQTVGHGKDANAPTIPNKEGYTQTAPTWDKDGKNITADTEINAIYTINEYTITFMDENGVYKTMTYKHGETVKMPEAPKKDGYTVKWETTIDKATGNATIKAVYTANAATIPGSTQSPQTGDMNNLWMIVALAFVSGGLVLSATVFKKREEK